jgi:hypothetical protein
MTRNGLQTAKSASQQIDEQISALGDWRGRMLSQIRTLIRQANPDVILQRLQSTPGSRHPPPNRRRPNHDRHRHPQRHHH